MPEGYFSIKRDNELIASGSHFWCKACVVAKPLDDISPDVRYCQGCYDILLKEAELLPTNKRAAWMPKNVSRKTAPDTTQTTPARQEVVAKLAAPIISPAENKPVVMQHAGGRPRKEGRVSRATKWRRAKQGVPV